VPNGQLGHGLIWRTETADGPRLPETDTELVIQTERPEPETDIVVRSADLVVRRVMAAAESIRVQRLHLGADQVRCRARQHILKGQPDTRIGQRGLKVGPFSAAGGEQTLHDVKRQKAPRHLAYTCWVGLAASNSRTRGPSKNRLRVAIASESSGGTFRTRVSVK
jgi:hypothetical protein